MTVTIERTEQVYKGWTSLMRMTLSDGRTSFTREMEHHGSAVAVLPYDPDRGMALLVRMPRAPVLWAGEPDILEVPAGLIDAGEDLETCARREAGEEVGVSLGALDFIGTFWTCPGLSTERVSLFLAAYRAADRTSAGGGLEEENENITVVEMSLEALDDAMATGGITDLKTFTAVQILRQRRPDLF